MVRGNSQGVAGYRSNTNNRGALGYGRRPNNYNGQSPSGGALYSTGGYRLRSNRPGMNRSDGGGQGMMRGSRYSGGGALSVNRRYGMGRGGDARSYMSVRRQPNQSRQNNNMNQIVGNRRDMNGGGGPFRQQRGGSRAGRGGFISSRGRGGMRTRGAAGRGRGRGRGGRGGGSVSESSLDAQLDAYMGDDFAKGRLDNQLDAYFGRAASEKGESLVVDQSNVSMEGAPSSGVIRIV